MSMLTPGCIFAINNGSTLPVDKPVVQILDFKKMPGTQNDKYRLLISDGQHTHSCAMLGTQLNEKITSGELQKYTVCKIDQYVANKIGERKVIIIIALTIVQSASEAGQKYGNPEPIQFSTGNNNKPNVAETSVKDEIQPPTTPTGKGIPNMGPKSSPGKNVHPISSLNPYQNRWMIRARVTNKSDIRTWSNSRGEGKLFSVDLIDDTGEIRATAFNEQCDRFFDMIEVQSVYYISKAHLKNANKAFSSIRNDYEISFNAGTEVELCTDSPDNLPVLQFDFVPISNLENLPKDSIIDVIGVCRSGGDLSTVIVRSSGKEIKKRDMQLVDGSNTEVTLTLWGETAEKHDGATNPVIAIKGAKLSDFNGRSISSLMSSIVYVDPDIGEAHALRGWYDSEGSNMTVTSISGKGSGFGGPTNWKTFAEVKDQGLGKDEKPDYYTVKATVSLVKHETAMYKACANTECFKKVIDMNDGTYRCEKCNKMLPQFKWRILLQALLVDFSGTQWVTFFQEAAEAMVSVPADQLGGLKEESENNGDAEYINRMNGICFQEYIFKLRTKLETYNEEQRLKTIGITVSPINYVDYGKKLIADIKKMSG